MLNFSLFELNRESVINKMFNRVTAAYALIINLIIDSLIFILNTFFTVVKYRILTRFSVSYTRKKLRIIIN